MHDRSAESDYSPGPSPSPHHDSSPPPRLAGPTRRSVVAALLGAAGVDRVVDPQASGVDRVDNPAAERRGGGRRDGRCGPRRANCGTGDQPDCRNLNRDPDHCGACGRACPPSQRCMAGSCRLAASCAPAPVQGYRLVVTYPHDPNAFTQGLSFVDGVLYEGTGLNGRSSLREVDLGTGAVLRRRLLPDRHFGEGIAVLGDRVYQLTWTSGRCFVYDLATFDPVGSFAYRGEGWGLTTDGRQFVMSNGSAELTFRDPETFAATGRVVVRDGGSPISQLNELEWIGDEIWANVWQTDRIARIDPATGCVRSWINLAGILSKELQAGRPVDVLNGIAHAAATGRVFVTGKFWPALFEIAVP